MEGGYEVWYAALPTHLQGIIATSSSHRLKEFPPIIFPLLGQAFSQEVRKLRQTALGPGIEPEPCTHSILNYSTSTLHPRTWPRRSNYGLGSPEHLRLAVANLKNGSVDKIYLLLHHARKEQFDFLVLIESKASSAELRTTLESHNASHSQPFHSLSHSTYGKSRANIPKLADGSPVPRCGISVVFHHRWSDSVVCNAASTCGRAMCIGIEGRDGNFFVLIAAHGLYSPTFSDPDRLAAFGRMATAANQRVLCTLS